MKNYAGLRWPIVLFAVLLAFACGDNSSDSPVSADQDAVDRAERVLREIVAGRFDEISDQFDEGLRSALTADQLEEDWKSFIELKGAFRSQGEKKVDRREGITSVDIELRMAKEPGLFRVSFDPDGKIAVIYVLDEEIPIG